MGSKLDAHTAYIQQQVGRAVDRLVAVMVCALGPQVQRVIARETALPALERGVAEEIERRLPPPPAGEPKAIDILALLPSGPLHDPEALTTWLAELREHLESELGNGPIRLQGQL